MTKQINYRPALSILFAVIALNITSTANAAEDVGKQVFIQACASCHSGGIKGWLSGAQK